MTVKNDVFKQLYESWNNIALTKGGQNLQFTKDESLASFQWCLLRIAHNYPLLNDKQNAYLTKLSAWLHTSLA